MTNKTKHDTRSVAWDRYNSWALIETYPAKYLDHALPFVAKRRRALDLGAGTLKASNYLAKLGFNQIDAVDICGLSARMDRHPNVIVYQTTIEEFVFPEGTYDLIHARASLPYVNDCEIESVFARCAANLSIGGVFWGNFFGPENEHVETLPQQTTRTLDEIRELLHPLKILWDTQIIVEKVPRYDGGTKRVDIINFIAIRTH